jgi:hypothetical protein
MMLRFNWAVRKVQKSKFAVHNFANPSLEPSSGHFCSSIGAMYSTKLGANEMIKALIELLCINIALCSAEALLQCLIASACAFIALSKRGTRPTLIK